MPRETTIFNSNSPADGPPDKSPRDELPPLENYQQALNFLYDRIDYEKIGHAPYTANHYRLDRMRQLLELLGRPQDRYTIVHIAGTKGKGTTATLLYDCLRACGHRTGLYTSPHLQFLEERIQFQGSCCSPAELIELVRAVRAAAASLEASGGGRATFFELTTAMGMLHFANQSADCAVLETGLGGRLDSTNVCQPAVSIITSISLDHQAQLGNTIAEIAREKAGIIKPRVPIICTARHADARHEVERQAISLEAPLQMIDRDFSVVWRPLPSLEGDSVPRAAEVDFTQPAASGSSLPSSTWGTRMLGRHQADNIAAALATLQQLHHQGWDLPLPALHTAIEQSLPPARLEVISRTPIAVIDTAHNPASIQAALTAIEEHFPGRDKTVVFAASRDKDYREMLQLLLRRTRHLLLTSYLKNPRGLASRELFSAAEELAAQARAASPTASLSELHHAESPAAAWRRAKQLASADSVILATGSFFLAAELLENRDAL